MLKQVEPGDTAEKSTAVFGGTMILHRSPRLSTAVFMVWVTFSTLGLASSSFVSAQVPPPVRNPSTVGAQFDQTFFNSRRDVNAEAARGRWERLLQKRLEVLDRTCGLSPAQRTKLELAARSTMLHFFDGLALQKREFLAEITDPDTASRQLTSDPEILSLKRKLRNGPFGEDSVFGKTIQNVLTREQLAKLQARSERAAVSNRPITADSVADLVQVARIPQKVNQVEWAQDGTQFGCLVGNRQIDIYLPLQDTPIRTLGKGKIILGFDFGPQANVAAYVDSMNQLTVVGVPGRPEFQIPLRPRQSRVEFSPDGKMLITSGMGTKAGLWSTATGELLREYETGALNANMAVAFSPDSQRIAVSNCSSTTRLFDVNGGQIREFSHRWSNELRFDPSGRTLAVTYLDGQLILWNVENGNRKSVQVWSDEAKTLDWSPDGSLLVTGGYNTPLTFWKAADLSIAAQFDSAESITSVRFSPDGTRLLVAGVNRDPENRWVETWAVP